MVHSGSAAGSTAATSELSTVTAVVVTAVEVEAEEEEAEEDEEKAAVFRWASAFSIRRRALSTGATGALRSGGGER
jgi:hypothetical protein